MKRRSFLRNALLGTTAVAITPSAFLASCDPGVLDPVVTFGNVGGLAVPEPPFVNPIASLNATSAIGASLDAVKNSEVLIGVVNPTFCFGYGNSIWGPTLRIRKGESVNIDVANHINETSNVHFHGLMLNAGEDDGVDDGITNGGSRNYNFTVNNRAGLYWYHPQYGKSAGKQVNIGLGGLFVVEDDEEDGINLPSGDRSIFLVLQDKRFNEDASMFYGTNTAEEMVGYFGETIMINGVTGALKDGLSQRFYRLRICNGSNARIYNLGLDTEDLVDLGFYIIGGDGGLLENITADPTGSIYLAPGERVDVIVDFTAVPVGSFVELKSRQFSNAGAFQGAAGFTLMRFNITTAYDETYTLPGSLSSIVSLTEGDAAVTRNFNVSNPQLNQDYAAAHADAGDMHEIEGEPYTAGVSSFNVNFGATELWEFVNNGDEPVAMHVYGVQFQIIERVGGRGNIKVWEKGWKDTILALPTETVRVVIPFTGAPGRYYFCATNLEAADSGMIQAFDIV